MKAGSVALALSALALGFAVLAWTRADPQPQRAPMRVDRVVDLERQVAELTREVESLKTRAPTQPGPVADEAAPAAGRADDAGLPQDLAKEDAVLRALVDDAVDRKAGQVVDELRVKANKKPAIGVFAATLELTEEQRADAERVIVDGQRQIHRILNIPTRSGASLMDELVEIAAKGLARPGKDHGFGQWLGRVLTERIPGADETYGARIESVKSGMRETFRRQWTEAQYREFEEWGVDPTEIEKVPDSPNEALYRRITERATQLGAELPDRG